MTHLLSHISKSDCLLSALNSLSVSVYCKDNKGIYLEVNDVFVNTSAMGRSEIIGKKDKALIWGEQASQIEMNDQEVIYSKKPKTTIEIVKSFGKTDNTFLSQKIPMINEFGKVTGIFCCSINLTEQNNKNSNNSLTLTSTILSCPQLHLAMQGLTSRETQIVQFIKKGFTNKEIGVTCRISTRTVEHHIENIKNKFGVSSKFALLKLLLE